MASENPNKPRQFFLKTAPLPGQPPNPYTNLYLRHHGSGIDSVVLTEGPPKFIKGHCERDGRRIMFTSATHPGRKWGLTMRVEGKEKAGWEKVEIVEDGGSDGLWLDKEMTGEGTELEYFEATVSGEENVWRGWMACEWATGHPQLFWVTDQLKGDLPTFCHKVRVVSEMLESVLE